MVALSICIPTWQRPDHLRDVLESLCCLNLGVSLEVLVSDNASEAPIAEVCEGFAGRLPLRFVRQRRNIGAEANLMSSFRLARGELCVYLGDDDRLIEGGLRSAVQRLLEKPERSAVFAPWEDWDEGAESSMGMHFDWPEAEEGDQPNPLVILSRFVANKGFPEIGIYRTRLLQKVLFLTHQVYWAHPWIGRLSGVGTVYVQREPFYRSLARTKAQRDRPRLGVEQTMKFQDRYRAGLEVGFWEGLRQLGVSHLPVERHAQFAGPVETLQAGRLRAGAWLSHRSLDQVRSVEFGRRAKLYSSKMERMDEEGAQEQARSDREKLLAGITVEGEGRKTALSLCILSDGDSLALARTLASVDRAAIECLVVSPEVLGQKAPEIRYLQGEVLQNDARRRLAGLWHASGDFVATIPAGATVEMARLWEMVETMQGRPECLAWMPCTKAVEAEATAYRWEEAMEMLLHLVAADFDPDFCLFRREGLEPVLLPTQTFAPSWQWWWTLARKGEVCLGPVPWFELPKPLVRGPETLRAALELLLFEVLEHRSLDSFSEEVRQQLRQLLNRRMLPCLHDGAVALWEDGDAMGALEMLARRQLWLGTPHPLGHQAPMIDRAAAGLVQTAAARTATCEGLVLCGMESPWIQEASRLTEEEVLAHPPSSVVLVPDAATAERLRHRMLPGLVMVWPEVRRFVERLV